MSTRTRSLLMCGAAALTLALAPANRDPVQASGGYVVTLSGARVDMIGADRIVASFDATGDIRGLFTADLRRGADGSVRGEWVLVSRYLRDLTPDGQPDDLANERRAALPGAELHLQHKEYFEIVERGTLRGSIAGGSLAYDVDGRLRSIEGLQLSIAGGNNEFARATGTGSLSGANLQTAAGSGSLALAIESAAAAEGVK